MGVSSFKFLHPLCSEIGTALTCSHSYALSLWLPISICPFFIGAPNGARKENDPLSAFSSAFLWGKPLTNLRLVKQGMSEMCHLWGWRHPGLSRSPWVSPGTVCSQSCAHQFCASLPLVQSHATCTVVVSWIRMIEGALSSFSHTDCISQRQGEQLALPTGYKEGFFLPVPGSLSFEQGSWVLWQCKYPAITMPQGMGSQEED